MSGQENEWRLGFVQVPRTLIPDRNLNLERLGAIVVLRAMAAWDRDGPLPRGAVDVTQAALAKRFRWSVDAVRRWLAGLVEAGIITTEPGTGRSPSRITFTEYDPPRASAHPQSLAAQRESPRPRHPQDGKAPQASAYPQSLVPEGLSGGQCHTTVASAYPQSLVPAGETPDARRTFFKKEDATMGVQDKAGREQVCKCGRATLRPGDLECSSCILEHEAANLRALDLEDDDARYLRDEREGMQMEVPDER